MQVIVKKQFSPADEKRAALAASVFHPQKSTSSVSNVLDFADLQKTVVLCDAHARRFDRRAQMKYGYYMQREYPFVMGNCDYCKVYGPSQMFIHETVLKEVWRTREQAQREREYATIV